MIKVSPWFNVIFFYTYEAYIKGDIALPHNLVFNTPKSGVPTRQQCIGRLVAFMVKFSYDFLIITLMLNYINFECKNCKNLESTLFMQQPVFLSWKETTSEVGKLEHRSPTVPANNKSRFLSLFISRKTQKTNTQVCLTWKDEFLRNPFYIY